jgi:hypothetical protein
VPVRLIVSFTRTLPLWIVGANQALRSKQRTDKLDVGL